ncbi:hypothetical protein BGW41_001337 [Actinomortierella wolfii]|nr:hypothetical protein BGW41_001337 [Actinomortierella wolfii]
MPTTDSGPRNNSTYDLDIFGQAPLHSLYIPLTLAYLLEDESRHSAIIDTLTTGLKRLTESFPWVAGQVINEGADENNSGVYKIVPFKEYPSLVVKDLTKDPNVPSFASLKESKFPCSASVMDEGVLSAQHSLSCYYDHQNPKPVFVVQVTFIKGGLFLTCTGHHLVFDSTGQGHIMSYLSKACHNEEFTKEELNLGNIDRRNIVPYLENVSPTDDPAYEYQIAKPPSVPEEKPTASTDASAEEKEVLLESQSIIEQKPTTVPTLPKAAWVYFSFDASSLASLKADANASLLPSVPFVSTDDALAALVYKSAVRARLPRFKPSDKITFGRTVNVRKCLGLPESYHGMMMNMTYRSSTYEEVDDEDLGIFASKLRAELDYDRLAHRTKGFATLLKNAPNKWPISVSAGLDLNNNFNNSSWAKMLGYELDFNLGLGKPVMARKPSSTPAIENSSYIMPKTPEGEIILAICMRDEDMERLKADPVFTKYAQYIG